MGLRDDIMTKQKSNALTKLVQKFKKSSTGTFLAVPVAKNNKLFICVYITHDENEDRKARIFDRVYRYRTDFGTLCRFYAQKSIGQAYNKYFKFEGKRSKIPALGLDNYEEGIWKVRDIMQFALSLHSNIVLDNILLVMKHRKGTEFNTDAITEAEKKTFLQLKMEKEIEEIASEREKAIAKARNTPLGVDY
jgi:hypothetical protein